MSEPVTKQRPSIDFDEFERTIRDAAKPPRPQVRGQEDDPLAELARLVGTHHDPYGEVFAQNEAPQPDTRRPSIDFAAIEAGLRGTIPAHEAHAAQGHDQYSHDDQTYYDQHDPAPADGDAGWYDHAQDAPPVAPSRSRRPIYAMAAVILVGVVGIGVAFAYKGSNSGPREIAMIKAAPGPTKIQPPADGSADQPNSDASMLDKAQQPAPTKLASHEEQPVDLAQTVQNAPRDVGLSPLYNFGAANNAASVPVPAPPGQADQKPAMGIAGDIEPIRVKTRSYRPDGTPIPNDQPPAAAMAAAPPASKADKAAIAKASTPKSATPKSTTRVAVTPKPKPIVTADAGDAAPTDLNAAAATPAPHKVKPVKAPAKPVETASATDATDDAAQTASVPAGGGFAVQLAAPGSEAEAKAASTKLSAKFASALSGHRLSFHKADSNGKAVYRVRVGSLSREEATGICEKLKSSGGSCFVAKN
ncbi:SPOR domain-containing protein [Beijerinckia sp. L45]|uniref:SPOR domain-containing protein n=1 Tax=Beijerinckia sp. L45 TaxID=1641855 RepID=UPI00131E30E7|nr:SPOR domain-containing protein [Beijerinckia sp. L45]